MKDISYFEKANSPKRQYDRDMNILDEEYKAKKKILDDRLKGQQGLCKHKDTTYNPDPSGNHDSYHECNTCGKII